MSLTPVDDDTFVSDVVQSDKAVLVDFWAERCMPCVMLARTLEDLADSVSDRVTIVGLNVDENPQTAAKYRVTGVPTLILFKGGEPAASLTGSVPKSRLKEWINANV